jgi:hypothetical protein
MRLATVSCRYPAFFDIGQTWGKEDVARCQGHRQDSPFDRNQSASLLATLAYHQYFLFSVRMESRKRLADE